MDRIVRHLGRGDIAKYVVLCYGYTPENDTRELFALLSGVSVHAIGAEWGSMTQGDGKKEREIEGDKERTPPTVQRGGLVVLDRKRTYDYLGCMAQLCMICQGKM